MKNNNGSLLSPIAASSVGDGKDGFTELDGACGIAIANVGSITYALVTSEDDDGVQIIDITDPSGPVAVAALTDGEGGFTELDGAAGIATAWIGSDAYAVVSGTIDDGVQIIALTTDTTAPEFSSAALIGVTGVLTITFSEPIDSVSVSNIDLTRLFISDLDQENQIPLEGAIITTIAYTDTINVTLTETQRQSAVSLTIPQLDISSSAVTDPTGNPIDASTDNPIAIVVIVSKTSDMPHHSGGISSARAFADVDPRVSVHVPSCSVSVDRSTWVVVRRGLREDVNTYIRGRTTPAMVALIWDPMATMAITTTITITITTTLLIVRLYAVATSGSCRSLYRGD